MTPINFAYLQSFALDLVVTVAAGLAVIAAISALFQLLMAGRHGTHQKWGYRG